MPSLQFVILSYEVWTGPSREHGTELGAEYVQVRSHGVFRSFVAKSLQTTMPRK